ncbi:hypothetical protein RAS12_12090 [Achromobacter seleniivolatilans]|uniref:Uncharacterized protein n=1 Tax=Achromobacter seleniivolatilans TaxID=3047478 RepID=A0ABY9M7V8_9BURK|nr:hypothetical protein [Achromobacter sp. R39]WMD23078.1 hypothetical protein RAS12_12090 [Achromobacter sp. R39]
MNNPRSTDSVTVTDIQCTAHRALYEQLTTERARWTPELDRCVRAYFELQSPPSPEDSPLQMFANYGTSLGIAQSLHAMGCISEHALGHMARFASNQMARKLLPWNGRAFEVASGYGTPHETPSYH